MSQPDIDTIIENFEYLDEWDDRYRYLIELGNGLEPLAEEDHNPETKVQGCVSQVWLVARRSEDSDPVIVFRGDSDAHIVKGLVAVVLALFSGKRASEILRIDETEIFSRLRLQEHITPQRSNGLRSMVARIKQEAKASQPA